MTELFTISAAARMWNTGRDTNDMARRYSMKESTIYNYIQRIRDTAERFRLNPEKMIRPVNYKPRRVQALIPRADLPDGNLEAGAVKSLLLPPRSLVRVADAVAGEKGELK